MIFLKKDLFMEFFKIVVLFIGVFLLYLFNDLLQLLHKINSNLLDQQIELERINNKLIETHIELEQINTQIGYIESKIQD